jgi:hypothetical protein
MSVHGCRDSALTLCSYPTCFRNLILWSKPPLLWEASPQTLVHEFRHEGEAAWRPQRFLLREMWLPSAFLAPPIPGRRMVRGDEFWPHHRHGPSHDRRNFLMKWVPGRHLDAKTLRFDASSAGWAWSTCNPGGVSAAPSGPQTHPRDYYNLAGPTLPRTRRIFTPSAGVDMIGFGSVGAGSPARPLARLSGQ